MPELPESAAWRHTGARNGFEVLFARQIDAGHRLEGFSTGLEDGEAFSVRYVLLVGSDWTTRSAEVVCNSDHGTRQIWIDGDATGGWTVDGAPRAELAGCLDVDLEASACTNLLPMRRLQLEVGERAEAPAVYVRAPSLAVERLEQSYRRIEDDGGRRRYDYASPRFDFHAQLVFDDHGMVLEYPGIATRVG